MRILHTADWHLGRTLEGRDRLPEHEAFMDELVTIIDEYAIDAVLMAGDVFDSSNPPASAERFFYESMSRLSDKGKRPIIVIAGNHDQPERLAAAMPLLQEQSIHIVGWPRTTAVKVPIASAKTHLHVAALPYPSEARLNESFSDAGVFAGDDEAYRMAYDARISRLFQQLSAGFTNDNVNMVMSHLFMAGGAGSDSERPIEVGGAYTVRPGSLPDNIAYTALGHLHRPQWVREATSPTRYAGSPLAFSFNETGVAKSVSIIEAHPGEPAEVTEIPLSSGKALTRWKATEGLSQVDRWLDEGRGRNDWIELSIHSEYTLKPDEIQAIRRAHPGIVTIRMILPEETFHMYETRRDLPIEELFRQFYEKKTGGAVPEPALTQLFLELLEEDKDDTRQEVNVR
ncbi:exonuclease SbcCD subunit D [Natribacillus halophilus]|uniref:Nuclease SbcCD subunit D n=1 Tax=Natribacillus halophilus TaxID=549003 RepID=A0A1G8J7C4_9BACI|nr:exonuclease SbcCD subunit D [Natribacillus halophilus]SDI26943.1 Exodeoxyribonuclease I subunit D [Natribacillus halophilus]